MKILIIGITGYVGSCLHYELQSHTIYGTYNTRKTHDYINFNNNNIKDLDNFLSNNEIDLVINAAGCKDIHGDKEILYDSNVNLVKTIVNIVHKHKLKLVHISTDYVFCGDRGWYNEESDKDPKTYYGFTKSMAENDIKYVLDDALIIRTGGLFWKSHHLFSKLLENLKHNKQFDAYVDRYNTPTSMTTLALSIIDLYNAHKSGIIHIHDKLKLNRYNFLAMYLKSIGTKSTILNGIVAGDSILIPYDLSLASIYENKHSISQFERMVDYENSNYIAVD